MIEGVADFSIPRRVIHGRDAAQALRDELHERALTRAFVLTTPSLLAQSYLTEILGGLGTTVVGVHSGLTAHTPDTGVLDAAKKAREAGAQALLAIGGGSVIDGAKIVRLCMDEGLHDVAAIAAWRKSPRITATAPTFVICVPTTLSAAEFSGIAGMLDTVQGRKSGLHHPALVPDTVVLDPRATTTAPEWLILSSGIRAVDHCVETLLSARPSAFAEPSARAGLKQLATNLPALRMSPADLEVRANLQMAMWLSMVGPCIGVPLGASHAIGRALGGVLGVPHGRTSCVMLSPTLAWNAGTDLARQATLLDLFPDRRATLSETVRTLVETLGEPVRLRDLDLLQTDLPGVVEPALAMLKLPSTCGNARPITGADDVRTILDLAW